MQHPEGAPVPAQRGWFLCSLIADHIVLSIFKSLSDAWRCSSLFCRVYGTIALRDLQGLHLQTILRAFLFTTQEVKAHHNIL